MKNVSNCLLIIKFSIRIGAWRHQQEHSGDHLPIQLAKEANSPLQNRQDPEGPQQHPDSHEVRRLPRLDQAKGEQAPEEAPTVHRRRERAPPLPLHHLHVLNWPGWSHQPVHLHPPVQPVQHHEEWVQERLSGEDSDHGDQRKGSRCRRDHTGAEECNVGVQSGRRESEEEAGWSRGVWFIGWSKRRLLQFGWTLCVRS